ncbi:MAG: hypothetical protein ACOYXR_03100 [Nitrospirota bacterium]
MNHGLYAALRGGGAVIEGVEFWGTHRTLIPRHAGHFLVAALCVWLMARTTPAIDGYLPTATALLLPWYLVAVEWAWSQLPIGVAAAVAAWGAQISYLSVVSVREIVDAVVNRRGGAADRSERIGPRIAAFAWMLVGGIGCAALAYVPVVGPPATLALACPVLGAGFVTAAAAARGAGSWEIIGVVRSRIAMVSGLGAGVLVALAVPVVNLIALPCAAAGTVCLVLREERGASLKTSAGTVPYVWPGR